MSPEFDKLQPELSGFCTGQSGPGPGAFTAISLAGVAFLAERLMVSRTLAMAACLERGIWPLRFARNRGAFTADEQRRLLLSHAAIIGCGGLGGHAATLLARAGVGKLTLCDGDAFSESNLNRQLLCREGNLGRNKAEAAANEIAAIASHVELQVFRSNFDADNAGHVLEGVDIVLDGLDSISTRLFVASVAAGLGIPFVHAAIAGGEGFVALLEPGSGVLTRSYGENPPKGEDSAEARTGVPTTTPAATAALQAAVALRAILGKPCEPGALYHADWHAPFLEILYI